MLRGPFDRGRGGPGGWRIVHEPELHLGRDIVVPDLAGWRRDRLPSLPTDAYFRVPSDWIGEVVLPSAAALDRIKKLGMYAREKVAHAWLIEPLAQLVEVLRLESGRWSIVATHAATETVRLEPFTELERDLTLLWDESPPVNEDR